MTVKDTLYSCLIRYSNLYENKWQVYQHLFSSYGNGYDWVDGELIEWLYAKRAKDENGYPKLIKPTLSKLGIKRAEIPERVMKEAEDFTPIFHTWLPYRLKAEREKFADRTYSDYCYMHNILGKEILSKEKYIEREIAREPKKHSILKSTETIQDFMLKRQSRKYSYVYNYPDDIKPDWAEARQEWEDYLKSINCYLK